MDDGDRFTARVVDHARNGSSVAEAADDPELLFADPSDDPTVDLAMSIPSGGDAISEEAVAARMGLALLAGLVDTSRWRSSAAGWGRRSACRGRCSARRPTFDRAPVGNAARTGRARRQRWASRQRRPVGVTAATVGR